MKLIDFEKTRQGEMARYVANVPDTTGIENHQLVITGPDRLIRKSFAESDFELRIESEATQEQYESLLKPVREAEMQALSERAKLEQLDSFFEPLPPLRDPENSIFMSLRALPGAVIGDPLYVLSYPFMWCGVGQSIGMVLPPVCQCYSTVAPVSGDIDLFLFINFGITPVATSTTRGSSAEQITFGRNCLPWTLFLPFFNMRAVGTFSTFTSIFVGWHPYPWLL